MKAGFRTVNAVLLYSVFCFFQIQQCFGWVLFCGLDLTLGEFVYQKKQSID